MPTDVRARELLRHYARTKRRRGEPVFCLQVGANDGITNDPVHEYVQGYGWHALLLEPLVDVFERELKATYAGNSRVTLENAALAPRDGVLPLYTVAISSARWATGLSSFRRSAVEAHVVNGYIRRMAEREGVAVPEDERELIEVTDVRSVTFETLVEQHGIARIDVLCIDAEGFDLEILKLVDFERFTPDVVLFESKNLSGDERTEAQALLRARGYDLFRDGGDTVATTVRYPWPARLRALVERHPRRAWRVGRRLLRRTRR